MTSFVPAAVPSDFQSSLPWVASVGAEEERAADVRERSTAPELALPGLMSLTSFVPAAVPSDFQSSTPCVPSSAAKKSVPATFVRSTGSELRAARG